MNAHHKTIIGIVTLSVVVITLGLVALADQSAVPASVETVAVTRANAQRMVLDLAPSASHLTLRALPADSTFALTGDIEVGGREALTEEVVAGEGLELRYQTRQRFGIHVNATDRHTWDLAMARDLPTDLALRARVARATLDLRDTDVRSLDLTMDIGRSTVFLPTRSFTGTVTADIGDVDLILPKDANATITVQRGLTTTQVSDDFTRTNQQYRLSGSGPEITLTVKNDSGRVSLSTY
ncbi:MAG: hypothetical protein U5L04_10295 [Trueperaceae bacterium]|nr:hypothetical protein [Trueperaceae bacterium]